VRIGADAAFCADAEQVELALDLSADARGVAALDLLDLIAKDRIDEIGEVMEQVQL